MDIAPFTKGFKMIRRVDLDKEVADIDPAAVAIHRTFPKPEYCFSRAPCPSTLQGPASNAPAVIFDNPTRRL
jgi:hypothetical protein